MSESAGGVLHELVVKLTVDDVGFVTGLKKSLLSTEAWKKQMIPTMKGLDQAFGSIVKTATHMAEGLAVVGVAIGTHLVREQLKAIDAMAKMSDKTAINIETLYGFKQAAEVTGVSLESVASAAQKMERNISLATNGNKELTAAFQRLNLNVYELRKAKPEEALGMIMDALKGIPEQSDRIALQFQVLGRGSLELTNFLRIGSEGLMEFQKEAKKTGEVVNRFDAAKIEIVNQSFLHLHDSIETIAKQLTIQLSPYLAAAADEFTEMANSGDHGAKLIHDSIEQVVKLFAVFIDAVRVLRIGFAGIADVAAYVGAVFYNVGGAIAAAISYGINMAANFSGVFEAAGKNIGASFDLLWAGLKSGIAEFVLFTTNQLAKLMDQFASVLSVLPGESDSSVRKMETSVREASLGMTTSIGKYATDARAEFDKVKQSAGETGDKMREAFDVAMEGASKVSANPIFQELADAADQNLAEARKDLQDLINAPWATTTVDAWVEHAKEKMDELAQKIKDAAPGEKDDVEAGGPPVFQDEAWKNYQEALAAKWMAIKEDQVFWERSKNDQIELMTQEHLQDIEREEADSIAKTNALRKQGLKGQLVLTSNVLDQLSTLMQAHDRKAFEFGKVAAIANAIINTAQGATKALAQGGFYGIAMAGAVIAAGAVQIAQIKGTSFNGGGSGNTGKAGSASTFDTSAQNASVNQGGGGGSSTSNVNITLLGSSFDQKQVRSMIDQINTAVGDGARIKVA